jgi:type I restriction-modification system DNA methylase subunit
MVDYNPRELTDKDIVSIVNTYDACRGGTEAGEHLYAPAFCRSATLEAVRKPRYLLAPGLYLDKSAK